MCMRQILADMKANFFAALTGMFLYLSLARMFPVLQDLVDEPPDNMADATPTQYFLASRRKSAYRLCLANLGFLTALAILAPLVRKRCRKINTTENMRDFNFSFQISYEKEIEEQIESIICS